MPAKRSGRRLSVADLVEPARKATGAEHIGTIAERICPLDDAASTTRYEQSKKSTPLTAEIARAAAAIVRRELRTARQKPEAIASNQELCDRIDGVRELLRWAGEQQPACRQIENMATTFLSVHRVAAEEFTRAADRAANTERAQGIRHLRPQTRAQGLNAVAERAVASVEQEAIARLGEIEALTEQEREYDARAHVLAIQVMTLSGMLLRSIRQEAKSRGMGFDDAE